MIKWGGRDVRFVFVSGRKQSSASCYEHETFPYLGSLSHSMSLGLGGVCLAHEEMRNRVFLLGRSRMCVCEESRACLGGLRTLPEATTPLPPNNLHSTL